MASHSRTMEPKKVKKAFDYKIIIVSIIIVTIIIFMAG